MAQLRTGSSWLAVEMGWGRGEEEVVRREARLCQRCSSAAIDDAEHMVFAQTQAERLQVFTRHCTC